MLIEIDEQQQATILAALRHYQKHDCQGDVWLDDIATNGGKFEPLGADDVDDLCEHINCGYKDEAPVKYYLVEVKGRQDHETHGPYATELEQHQMAVVIWNSKSFNRGEDALLFLDVRGEANYCFVPRDFLNDPAEELARLKEQEPQEEDSLNAKIKRYLKNGGHSCLFCGDSDIVGDSYEHEEGYVTQDVTCSACGKSWRDTLTLTSVTPLGD